MKKYFFILSCIISLFYYCHKENPTKPPSKKVIKNPREYTWTVDTLIYPGSFQTSMRDIWGSSAKDIYVVGHNSDMYGKMFHYNGEQWLPVNIHKKIDGSFRLNAIYGLAADDIWVAGRRYELVGFDSTNNGIYDIISLIVHYNGTSWAQVEMPEYGRLYDIWGASPNDIYAVGDSGLVLHYIGSEWQTQLLSPPTQLQYLRGDDNILFTSGSIIGNDSTIIFKNSSNIWQVHDRQYFWDDNTRFGSVDFYSPEENIYYSIGPAIHKWQNSSWSKIVDTGYYMSGINGSGADNIFAVGQFRTVYHYNGTDWAKLEILPDKVPYDAWPFSAWTDGQEAFICGTGSGGHETYILHGK